ncbi:MAG: pyrrolo-quinoline quinone [Verrucomicrobiales bacterium]|nr:pyrrolo-quinoline quinone [Verrucomicrobiales bacterium]|tara:strand:- start:204 stop:1403 length:1200 start_codon:yes stop_codon:yes gene_type:complete
MKTRSTLALSLALSLSIQADNWTQFRGLDGASVSGDKLPTKLDKKNISWSVDLPGRGLSSPIVYGNKVFLSAASGPDQRRLHVICLNADTGKQIWERQFWATGRTMTHPKTCVAAPTPVCDGERVYVLYSSNDLICLDHDGNVKWLRGLTLDYPNASNSLGMSSSPIVIGDTLVVQVENDSESFAAGINVQTGVNRWKLDRPKAANWTSPTVAKSDGKYVAILQSSKGIHALNPRSGEEVWYFGGGASTIPSSTFAGDGVLYVPANGITALKPGSKTKDVKELWVSGQLKPGTSSPVVMGQNIFTVNSIGVLTCGDINGGKRLWQIRMKGKKFSATPVAAGGFLYAVNEEGLVQVIDVKGEEGEVISTLDLGETVLGTPSVARNSLFIRSDGRVWKIGS